MTDHRLSTALPKMPEDDVRSLPQKPRTYDCPSVVRWYNRMTAITVLKLRPFGFLPGFNSVVWAQRMEICNISIANFVSKGVHPWCSYDTVELNPCTYKRVKFDQFI